MARRGDGSRGRVYVAVIGDITGSRRIRDRAGVQRRLQQEVAALNAGSAASLAAPLKVVAGDEVQGLLVDPGAAVEVVVRLADALHPVGVSWGLGRGQLTTDLEADVSVLDGPCFHNARNALSAAARERTWLSAAGFPEPHNEVVTALFRLMWAIRSRWTETQVRYVRAARGRLQQEAAEQLAVTKQSVSKTLDAAQFAQVQAGEEAARRLLGWLGTLDEGRQGKR